MDNSTDALIMAGSILLLIIALTVTISSLTNLRTQAQDIFDDRDQLLATTDDSGYINYLQSGNKDKREVGIETVITSIRRMTKEDYTIYIKPKNNITDLGTEYDDIKVSVDGNNFAIKLYLSGVGNKYVNNYNLTKILYILYNNLETARFNEFIGIYQNKTAEGVSEANKSTYKVITYEQI